MIKPVLCITRKAINEQINHPGNRCNAIYPFDLSKVDQSNYHFLQRSLADTKDPVDIQIAKLLPQVLPYVLVTCGEEVLTYSRAKGAEDRLHGSLSCGFGGHVDLPDIDLSNFSLEPAVFRELEEELNLDIFKPNFNLLHNKQILIDDTNPVGSVHAGLVYTLVLDSKDDIKPDPSEIALAEWKTPVELFEEIDRYENWSQTLIRNITQGTK